MKKKNLSLIILLIIICLFIPFCSQSFECHAEEFEEEFEEDIEDISEVFVIVDEQDNYLSERSNVKVGDIIITKNFEVFEVYIVDEVDYIAKARLIDQIKKPLMTRKQVREMSNSKPKKIGLYMTHNDESYLIGDGESSIYGAGGIHDIAKKLNVSLKNMGIETIFDEKLHIPHNGSAYSRSAVTAKNILSKNNVDAIFDIHRDGVARVNYAVNYGGKERCKVKIVVGQSNPNKAENLKFALYLMSVAEPLYPWLFSDIYFASGNYNQNLYSKCLLFEVGTYTIEKHLALDSVPYLADVINTTLFKTSVDEDTGNIIIGPPSSGSSVNDILDKAKSNDKSTLIVFLSCVFVLMFIVGALVILVRCKKIKIKNKNFIKFKLKK